MEFTLKDKEVILNRVMLADLALAMKVAETGIWKEEEKVEVTLQFNGVEVDAELLESTLQKLFTRYGEQIKEKYSQANIDKLIEARAKEIVQERAANLLEKINNLQEVLSDPDNLIKPWWEN